MRIKLLFILILIMPLIACQTKEKKLHIKAEILKYEVERDAKALNNFWKKNKEKLSTEDTKEIALASGRIPSFKLWINLFHKYEKNEEILEYLAIAARFPKNNFDKEKVFKMLKGASLTRETMITLLYLDYLPAYKYALHSNKFLDTLGKNIWRSKYNLKHQDIEKLYFKSPQSACYSCYKLGIKGVVKTKDILNAPLDIRYYGTFVCDNPELMIKDKDWQVRIAAYKSVKEIDYKKAFKDKSRLVRYVVLEKFLSEGKTLSLEELKSLGAMEARLIGSHNYPKEQIKMLMKKSILHKNALVPFLKKEDKKDILNDKKIFLFSKLEYLKSNFSPKEAELFALNIFKQEKNLYALQYLAENKSEFLNEAKEIVKENNLQDMLKKIPEMSDYKDNIVKKDISYYENIITKYKECNGFAIETGIGTLYCKFYFQQAPFTCFNFIQLIEKQYFDDGYFHRVVPGFVSQDGDPDKTGSGGPGYSIPCEYNELNYDKTGVIGMALYGKDTGGSQFFLTHTATPHLNQNYTIFAQVIKGKEFLQNLAVYSKIKRIYLTKDSQ